MPEQDQLRLYAFHCGTERSDLAVFDPFDPNVGTKIESPYFFYGIAHRGGLVLVDTGLHPEVRDDPSKRLGETADTFYAVIGEKDDVVSQIAMVGYAPTDVTHVITTHLHFDHAGGLEFFQHCPIIVQVAEKEFAYAPPVYQSGLFMRADFDHNLNWHEIDGEHDVLGDGRIVCFPTPGHTRGHQSVLVRLASQNIILIADAHYLIPKMRQRLLPSVVWSPDAMVASWERIEALEQTESAELISTHDIDFKANVRVAPDAWYE